MRGIEMPSQRQSHERRTSLAEMWLRFVRLYTFNTPIPKGKYRLYQTALKSIKHKPRALFTEIKDGRKFVVDLTTGMQETLFFIGEYERFITEVTKQLIGKDDVCLDVGANFGWYTTLMSARIGESGSVHSFEPVPKSFEELSRNCKLLSHPENAHTNNFALGDSDGTVKINLFNDQPSGHASLAAKATEGAATFDCRMRTLDGYLSENKVGDVAFMKADIEGAELMLLRGADRLFEQSIPPIILMEMALEQSQHFGYKPNDLIKYIGGKAKYDFYKIDEPNERLVKIDGFADNGFGANVFCIPQNIDEAKKSVINQFLL